MNKMLQNMITKGHMMFATHYVPMHKLCKLINTVVNRQIVKGANVTFVIDN